MPPSAIDLSDRRIVFVGGKGGVGKTTIAGALALRAADAGRRVLLVSTDPAHSLADLFDRPIGGEVRPLASGLHGLEIDPEAQVEDYLDGVRRNLKAFVRPPMYPEIERQIELTRHAPGAMEAALLDRVAELVGDRGGEYDHVVFDTAPTGHTLRLLALPEMMQAWTEGLLRSRDRSDAFGRALERLKGRRPEGESKEQRGEAAGDDLAWFDTPDDAPADPRARKIRELLLERRRKFTRARRILLDPDATAFVLVLIPERLPILESRKALDVLRGHRVPIAGMVVNRVLPADTGGEFLERRREQEARYLARIDSEFEGLRRIRVPLLEHDVEGLEGLREVAGHL